MKCLVPNCDNDAHHGGGVLVTFRKTLPTKTDEIRVAEHETEGAWMCRSCYDFLISSIHGCSVIERNVLHAIPKETRNPWDDDREHSSGDWQSEVAQNDTRLGYLDWVDSHRDAEED